MAVNIGRLTIKAAADAALAAAASKTRPITAKSQNFSIANTDAGRLMTIESTGNVFITASPNYVVGDTFQLFNNNTSQLTITANTGITMWLPNTSNTQGAANTGNRTLASKGFVTLTVVASNTFIVSGIGVS